MTQERGAQALELDSHIRFLVNESAYLRQNHRKARWAEEKAKKFDAIIATLMRARRDLQMAGIYEE